MLCNRLFIIRAAKTCCIASVFYGETFVYQNCGETALCVGESVFIRTSADKLVRAAIYNLFHSPVISRLIENRLMVEIHDSTVCNSCRKRYWKSLTIHTRSACVATLRSFQYRSFSPLVTKCTYIGEIKK